MAEPCSPEGLLTAQPSPRPQQDFSHKASQASKDGNRPPPSSCQSLSLRHLSRRLLCQVSQAISQVPSSEAADQAPKDPVVGKPGWCQLQGGTEVSGGLCPKRLDPNSAAQKGRGTNRAFDAGGPDADHKLPKKRVPSLADRHAPARGAFPASPPSPTSCSAHSY